MKKPIFDQIIDHFGGIAATARALGVTRAAIYLWDGVIPEGRAYQIESVTNKKFLAVKILAAQAKQGNAA